MLSCLASHEILMTCPHIGGGKTSHVTRKPVIDKYYQYMVIDTGNDNVLPVHGDEYR